MDHNFVGMSQATFAATDIVKTLTTNRTLFNSAGLLAFAPHNWTIQPDDLTQANWTLRGAVGRTFADGATELTDIGASGVDDLFDDLGGGVTSVAVRFEQSFQMKTVTTSGVLELKNPSGGGSSWEVDLSGVSTTEFELIDKDHAAVTVNTAPVSHSNGGVGIWFSRKSGASALNFFIKNIQQNAGQTALTYVATTSAAVYLPRLGSHVFSASSWVDKGLGDWEAGTDTCLHTEALDNVAWAKTTTTISSFAGNAPDGNATADDMLHTGSAGNVIQAIAVTDNTKVYVSSFVQKGTTGDHDFVKMEWRDASDNDNGFEAWFKITDGTVGTAQASGTGSYTAGSAVIINVENGYRIAAAGQIVSGQTDGELVLTNTTADAVDTAEETNSVAWWGHNVTESTVLLPYIPATTANVAVTEDLATQLVSTISAFNQSAMSVYADFHISQLQSTGLRNVINLDDGGTTDQISLSIQSGGGGNDLEWKSTHSADTDGSVVNSNAISASTDFKSILGFQDDDFTTSLDGAAVSQDTTAALPLADDLTIVRFAHDSAGNHLNGYFKRAAIYNSDLPDATLRDVATNGPS